MGRSEIGEYPLRFDTDVRGHFDLKEKEAEERQEKELDEELGKGACI